MERPGTNADIEQIVRGLTAAAKALRLYPATSPIPRQAVEAAAEALRARLAAEPVLAFKIARDGLAFDDETVAPGAPGAADLAQALSDHGVAEIAFMPGVDIDELIAFLTATLAKPEELKDRGGIADVMAADGVENIRTAAVSLTVLDSAPQVEALADPDGFLRDLASDPDKISQWLSVAVKGDPGVLAAGLDDLVKAAGAESLPALVDSLARAFVQLDADGRDAILGLALQEGPSRSLLTRVFARVAARDIASSLAMGGFGRNMLTMSAALSRLPLAERFGEVMAQVKEILPTMGRGTKELAFLDHMVDVRTAREPEPTLAASQPVYHKVAELAVVDQAQVDGARDDVLTSAGRTDEAAASTLLSLLDQQSDLALYRRTLDSLSAMVPVLIERGDIATAARVLNELAARESREDRTWPELTEMLRSAVAEATSQRSMKALIVAVAADPQSVPLAREVMNRAGEASQAAFVEEALAHKPDGLKVAEAVVGRRLIDMLAAAAHRVQPAQVAPLVAVLGREADARPSSAVEALMRRPDEQTRREVAAGLGVAGGSMAVKHLVVLLRDPSPEVAVAAVRSLGRAGAPGAASALAVRLSEIEVDTRDFAIAKEIVSALAQCSGPEAATALGAVAGRRALIKRGHFVEMTELARQALAQQQKGGADR